MLALPDTIRSGGLPQLVTAGLMLLTLYFGIFSPLFDYVRFAVNLFGNQLYRSLLSG